MQNQSGQLRPLHAIILLMFVVLGSCQPDPISPVDEQSVDLSNLPYEPRLHNFEVPVFMPQVPQPEDNLATEAGIALGRKLFFDPILSKDSTISCASCHLPEKAFTDGLAFSRGINGQQTPRSSMSLVNIAYQSTFFWDGRSGSLEDQGLHPIEDPIEMDNTWEEVERRLQRNSSYQAAFRAAFGIEKSNEITRDLTTKAIAQFERTILSYDSEYDRVTFALQGFYSDLEEDGRLLFFTEPSRDHPGCSHCHNAPLFGDERFMNNGLDSAETLDEFADPGRGRVTGMRIDNGKFRAPSLRNIALTAPYMHDGRFETLDQVLDHYVSGGHYSPSRDPQILSFRLSEYERQALLAFLETLTDTTTLSRPEFQAPD